VAKTKRCPNCRASNPQTAEWCSLCLERFVEQGAAHLPSGTASVGPSRAADPSAAPRPRGASAKGPAAGSSIDTGAFEVTEAGIRWICGTCGTPNALDAVTCEACGATFADTVRPKTGRIEGDPGKAALYSLFYPGAGHGYLGMWGQAIARAVLSSWVLLVTLVGILDRDVPGSLGMAAIFGVAALGLWLVAANDAYREARAEPDKVLLRGRRYLYVVLGLMAILFVVMFLALMSARSRGPQDVQPDPLTIRPWRSTSSPISTELPTI